MLYNSLESNLGAAASKLGAKEKSSLSPYPDYVETKTHYCANSD